MRSLHKQDPEPEKPQVLIFSGNETEVRLPGLHPYSQYTLNIRAFNGKGDGPTSSDQQFQTPEGGTVLCTLCTHLLYVLICQSVEYYYISLNYINCFFLYSSRASYTFKSQKSEPGLTDFGVGTTSGR